MLVCCGLEDGAVELTFADSGRLGPRARGSVLSLTVDGGKLGPVTLCRLVEMSGVELLLESESDTGISSGFSSTRFRLSKMDDGSTGPIGILQIL